MKQTSDLQNRGVPYTHGGSEHDTTPVSSLGCIEPFFPNNHYDNIYQKILDTHRTHIAQGDVLFTKREYEASETQYATALKIVQTKQYRHLQVECLVKLAAVYEANQDFTKEIALYNGAIARADYAKKQDIVLLIKKAEQLFLKSIKAMNDQPFSAEVDESRKTKLKIWRTRCTEEINKIEYWWNEQLGLETQTSVLMNNHELWGQRAAKVRLLYKQIDQEYKAFIYEIIEQSCKAFARPPCQFAFIALGSLSRGEATPHSDLEFAIILEEGQDSPENKEYFRNLTKWIQIQVLNLGETILPAVGIRALNNFYAHTEQANWFYDDITPMGIAFDGAMPGACKTPLGEINDKGEIIFDLIDTPSNYIKRLSPTSEHDIPSLTNIMTNIIYLYGTEGLVHEYVTGLEKHLSKPFMSHPSLAHYYGANLLLRELVKHEGALSLTSNFYEGKSYHIKKELYRFIDLTINRIMLANNKITGSSWERIAQVFNINQQSDINIALSIATEIRLKSYLIGQKQDDNYLIIPNQKLEQDRSFFDMASRFYNTTIPLYTEIVEFFRTKTPSISDFLQGKSFFGNSRLFEALTHSRLGRHIEAKNILLSIVESDNKHLQAHSALKRVYFNEGQYSIALTYAQHYHQLLLEDESTATQTQDNYRVAFSFCNIGDIYFKNSDFAKAKHQYEQALSIWGQA